MSNYRELLVRFSVKSVSFAGQVGRLITARWRCLPDTLIVGAQKAGTSSLFAYLSQHPQVITSANKEVHYFDGGLDSHRDAYKRGVKWYRSNFPLAIRSGAPCRVVEASPLYLFNPEAAQRIYQTIPDVKIIILLRDPVERAVSHYFHEVRAKREHRPIMRALIDEEELLRPVLSSRDYKSNVFIQRSYKARGLYAEQISRYLDFFSNEQICIVDSSKLFQDPDKAIRPVLEFLELNRDFSIPDKQARNQGLSSSPIDRKVFQYLSEFFAPHNEDLFDLLGRRFDW